MAASHQSDGMVTLERLEMLTYHCTTSFVILEKVVNQQRSFLILIEPTQQKEELEVVR